MHAPVSCKSLHASSNPVPRVLIPQDFGASARPPSRVSLPPSFLARSTLG